MFLFMLMIFLVSIFSLISLSACSTTDNNTQVDGDLDSDTSDKSEMNLENSEFTSGGETEAELEPVVLCPIEGDLGVGYHAIEIKFGGLDRNYEFYVPKNYDKSTPTAVVLNIPGFKMTPEIEEQFSLFNASADEKGFIVLYPMAYNGIWNTGLPPAIGDPGELEDVKFIRAVVEDLQNKICVDNKRVYATGMSMGASMVYKLACEATDLLAAIAPVAGASGVNATCNPSKKLPVLHMHGIEDQLVFYDDGKAAFDKWHELNGCKGDPETKDFNQSYCETYTDCEDDTSMVLCSMSPMGHCWPGGSEIMCLEQWGDYNDDISANDYMWEFFGQY